MARKFLTNVDLNYNQIQNVIIDKQPGTPSGVIGQIVVDTTGGNNIMKYYNGSVWVTVGGIPAGTGKPTPSVSGSGTYFYETGSQLLWYTDGATWYQVSNFGAVSTLATSSATATSGGATTYTYSKSDHQHQHAGTDHGHITLEDLNKAATLSADLVLSGTKTITVAKTPSNANDVVNKSYVDNVATGINAHDAVSYASTANISGTYDNGTSGVTATIIGTGTLTIDGYSVQNSDAGTNVQGGTGLRILLKDQTSTDQNGIYTVTACVAGTSWTITRAYDYDTIGEVSAGDFAFVNLGSTNAKFTYIQTSKPAAISGIGTTANAITFTILANGNISGVVAVNQGGTGATTAATAATNLGLGTSSVVQFSGLGLGGGLNSSAKLKVYPYSNFPSSGIGNGIDITSATISGTTVAVATAASLSIARPTYTSATNAYPITDAASLYIADAPLAAGSQIITNTWALFTPANIKAGAFYGSGANLTSLSASNINAGTLGVSNGGTGTTATPTNGQLLIGNGTNYTVATLGTSNTIITTGAGSLTIGIPQSVATTATPQFTSLGIGAASTGGTTAVNVTGGKTTLAAYATNYAALNLPASTAAFATPYVVGDIWTTQTSGANILYATATNVAKTIMWADLSNISGTLAAANGGTGTSATATTGYFLVGNGSSYTPRALATTDRSALGATGKATGTLNFTSTTTVSVNHALGTWVTAQAFDSSGYLVDMDVQNTATSGGTTIYSLATATTASYTYVVVG